MEKQIKNSNLDTPTIHQSTAESFGKKDLVFWWTLILMPIYCLFLLHIFTGEFNDEKQALNQLNKEIKKYGKKKTLEHLLFIYTLEKKPERNTIHVESVNDWFFHSSNPYKKNYYVLHMKDGDKHGINLDDYLLSTGLDVIADQWSYKKFRVNCVLNRVNSTLNSTCYFHPKSPWQDPEYKGNSPKKIPKSAKNSFAVLSTIDYKFSTPKIISIDFINPYTDTRQENLTVPNYKFDNSIFFRLVYFIVLSGIFLVIEFRPLKLLLIPGKIINFFLNSKEKTSKYNNLPKVKSEILKKQK